MRGRINLLKAAKLAGGCFAAMLTAEGMGLSYGASAGVIALLSIHDTKKETFRVVGRRLAAFGIALLLAPACFFLLGFSPAAIGLFLLLFAPACFLLKLQEGISVSTVLMTHFLGEEAMTAQMAVNEVLLLLIGTGVGALLNLYIPGREKAIRQAQGKIEEAFRELLFLMAGALTPEGRAGWEEAFSEASARAGRLLEKGEGEAYRDIENSLLSETRYYLNYMGMRRSQLLILERMRNGLCRLEGLPAQAEQVSGLFSGVGRSFHEYNNAKGLLGELGRLLEAMRGQPLPESRAEFEARAVLFELLLDMEQFLNLKRAFAEGLSARERERFWGRAGEEGGREW